MSVGDRETELAGGPLNFRHRMTLPFINSLLERKVFPMKKTGFALIAAGVLALACIASPRPAEAWRGRVGPGLAGGLVAGAVLGGLAASSAYAWAPGYGYGYDYGYYGPYGAWPRSSYNGSGCPARGYGKYYNCGRYAVPGYPRY